jgi:hypothetical protein
MMYGMNKMKRPDPKEMANDLFSKLDTSGQGYIDKTTLQNAFDQTTSNADASGNSTTVDTLFSQLDSNGDGKVTKQEFSDSVKNLVDQLDQQFQNARMQDSMSQMGGAKGSSGMPPGPPPSAGVDQGMPRISSPVQQKRRAALIAVSQARCRISFRILTLPTPITMAR